MPVCWVLIYSSLLLLGCSRFLNAKVVPELPTKTQSATDELDSTAGADRKTNSDLPVYWQAILGDICQLPGFPRATGDPTRYLECVRQNLAADRKDLGIWTLRECVDGFRFVAAARRCKSVRAIERQESICAGAKSAEYDFCPSDSADEFEIHEKRAAPRRCQCADGSGDDCLCVRPELLEPVKIGRRTRTTESARIFVADGEDVTPALRFQSFQTNSGVPRCQQQCASGNSRCCAEAGCVCPTTRTSTQQQVSPFTSRPPPQQQMPTPDQQPPPQPFQQQPTSLRPGNDQRPSNSFNGPPGNRNFNGPQSNGFNANNRPPPEFMGPPNHANPNRDFNANHQPNNGNQFGGPPQHFDPNCNQWNGNSAPNQQPPNWTPDFDIHAQFALNQGPSSRGPPSGQFPQRPPDQSGFNSQQANQAQRPSFDPQFQQNGGGGREFGNRNGPGVNGNWGGPSSSQQTSGFNPNGPPPNPDFNPHVPNNFNGPPPNGNPPQPSSFGNPNGPPPSNFEPPGPTLTSIGDKMRQIERVLAQQNEQLNRQQQLLQQQRQVLQRELSESRIPPLTPNPTPGSLFNFRFDSTTPTSATCQMTTTQQQYCPRRDQQAVIQPQPCALVQGSATNARYQGICSWMLDPLACDPESRCHFLQCQPAANNLFCGRWQRMPCGPATVFDAGAQLCVWDTSATPPPLPLPTPAPPDTSTPAFQFGNLPHPTLNPFNNNGVFGGAPMTTANSYVEAQSSYNNQLTGQQFPNTNAGFQSGNGAGFPTQQFGAPNSGYNQPMSGPANPGLNSGVCCCSTGQTSQNLCRGGVQIGSCSSNFQCPGQSVCQIGQMANRRPCTVCCYYRLMD